VHLVYFFALQSELSTPLGRLDHQPRTTLRRAHQDLGLAALDMGHLLEYIAILASSNSHRRGCPPWRRGALPATAMRGSRLCIVLASNATLGPRPLHAITTPSTRRRQVPRCGGRCTEHRRRRDARARTRLAADAGAGRSLYRALLPRRKESACVWRGPRPLCLHLNKPRSSLASCPGERIIAAHVSQAAVLAAHWSAVVLRDCVCSNSRPASSQLFHKTPALGHGGFAAGNPTKPPSS
jgi:hypothetical protein